MVNYPTYLRDDNLKTLFKWAVMHRLLLENSDCLSRTKRHAFEYGKRLGQLSCQRGVKLSGVLIGDVIFNEAQRLFALIENDA